MIIAVSLHCFTTFISHDVKNYFPRLWDTDISDVISVKICVWGSTPVIKTNSTVNLYAFFHLFSLTKYLVLIELVTFAQGFQLSKVTSLTAINFFCTNFKHCMYVTVGVHCIEVTSIFVWLYVSDSTSQDTKIRTLIASKRHQN